MKKIVTIILLLASSLSFADSRVISLDSSSINLGTLSQHPDQAALETVVLERNSSTPAKVKLVVNYVYMTNTCIREDVRDVLVPGSFYCESGFDHPMCYWHPDYIDHQYYCAEYADVPNNKIREITLDFKRSNKLSYDSTETFYLILAQKNVRSDDLNFSATADQTETPYEIEKTGLFGLGHGLKFKAIQNK